MKFDSSIRNHTMITVRIPACLIASSSRCQSRLLSFIIQSSYVMKVPSMGRGGALFPWSSRVAPQPLRSARIAEATQKRKNIVLYCRSVRNRAKATISLPRTHEHAQTIASQKKHGQLLSTWVGAMSILSLGVYSKQGVLSHNARRNSIPIYSLYE